MKRLNVNPKIELKKYCWELVNTVDLGKRSKDNGTPEQQYAGMIGECVVREMFGLGWVDGKSGCDGGFDFEYKCKKYDVKTMKRKVDVKDSYTNNFIKRQENYKVDAYIFCSWNIKKDELTVAGWIRKEKLNRVKRLKPKGTICKNGTDGKEFPLRFDMYEIDNEHLHFVNCIADMKMQMIGRWDKNSPFY